MKKEIENYQRKLKLSGSLMEIYPAVEATLMKNFFSRSSQNFMKIENKKEE